jgi:hypothetical protein
MLDQRTTSDAALRDNDPVLHPLLSATDSRLYDAAVEELIRKAGVTIDAVLNHYTRRGALNAADAEDVASTVRVSLLTKLDRLARGEGEPIATFEGYVARLAYNAVHDVFRGRGPHRAHIKKRVRAIAVGGAPFVVEKTVNGDVCRLRGQAGAPVSIPADVPSFRRDLGEATESLLGAAGGPLLLSDVVAVLGAAPAFAPPTLVTPQSTNASPLSRLERRQEMAQLWREIGLLPATQRIALLLNLRGEGALSVIALFLLTRVTTFDALAAALEMDVRELGKIWSELPWDDLTIAARLGIERQQVINLRKSARKRLARRSGRDA